MKNLLTVLVVSLISLNSYADKDRGGGIIYKRGLLDLALYNQEAYNDQTAGHKLPVTKAFKSVGFDRLNTTDSVIFQKAIKQVQKWQLSSPIMATKILEALVSMPIYFTNGEMTVAPIQYDIPKGSSIQNKDLKMIAVYYRDFGVFVSKQSVESLSEKNQIALLIHEGVRHLQISFQSLMSNQTVQKLTAQIMNDSGANDTLDTYEIMEGPILQAYLGHQSDLKDTLAITSRACREYSVLCEFSKMHSDSNGAIDTRTTIEILDGGVEQLKTLSEKNKGNYEEYEDMIVLYLDILAHKSWLAVRGLSTTLEGTKPAMFKVEKMLRHGSLDWALDAVNNRTFPTSDQKKILREARYYLVSQGLMKR